jgi:transposase
MMGRLKSDQGQLFYEFRLGDAVPEDHLIRKIETALDLAWLRSELAPHYSSMGRPSIDPELMIRMLVVGYVFAIRSERLVCREVQVNLAYRWFCKLGIEDAIPDHSAFSRARNERFREGDVFRRVFERVVETYVVQTLAPDRSDQPFGKAVLPRRRRCDPAYKFARDTGRTSSSIRSDLDFRYTQARQGAAHRVARGRNGHDRGSSLRLGQALDNAVGHPVLG